MSRRARVWAALGVYVVLGLLALNRWGFTVTSMGSASMAPTLDSNPSAPDRVLVDRFTPLVRAPLRGEIVHFRDEKGTWIMKRVIALPGEKIEIRDSHVWIDGKRLEAPAEVAKRAYLNQGHMTPGKVVQVDPDFYFVMGDDTQDSYDSRFWGCLARRDIRGIARAVIWPPQHAASL